MSVGTGGGDEDAMFAELLYVDFDCVCLPPSGSLDSSARRHVEGVEVLVIAASRKSQNAKSLALGLVS